MSTPNTNGPDPLPPGPNELAPLEGEAGIPSVTRATTPQLEWKGILALTLLVLSLLAAAAMAITRLFSSNDKPSEVKRQQDMPTAAATQARKLDMTPLPAPKASANVQPVIPALLPSADDREAEPIGVRRTGQGSGADTARPKTYPEDATVLLVSSKPGALPSLEPMPNDLAAAPTDPLEATKRNLDGYQRQLQGMLDKLNKTAAGNGTAGNSSPSLSPPSGATAAPAPSGTTGAGLFGGQLQGSATATVSAAMLGNRSLTLPKGTAFTCALKTRVISATSGFVGCQVQRNVFSDNGRVLLIERGSHMDGEYRVTSVRPGTVRIPVLWTRIRTPNGVTVAIDSPGTGPLGEAGIDGHVDNRWGERIGAAMLLSLIDDSIQLVIDKQTDSSATDTILLPSSTSNTSKLAEKVLDSTINIPPLVYQHQGGIVGIYVARDVDFSTVYALRAVPR